MEAQTKMTSYVNAARWIPTYMTEKHENLDLGIEVFWSAEQLTMIAYSGKAKNYSYFLKYSTFEQMETAIITFVTNIQRNEAAKKEEKQKALEAKKTFDINEHFQAGDILVDTWGYEQTQVDFYKVIEVSGMTLTVREICYQTVEGSEYSHGMADEVMPYDVIVESEAAFKVRVKCNKDGSASICQPKSYGYLRKWEGRAMYRSWYN